MNLKTSFFSKTLFRANIKRFWWIAAIILIAYLTFGILPLINYASAEGFMIMSVIACIIAAILPTILYSYLDFSSSVTCLHSFPIKRKAHYITHLVTIYAIVLIPAALSYIFGGAYILINSVPLTSPIKTIAQFFKMFPILIMLITIFTSGSVLANMVTGNPIAAIAFSGLFIGLPYYSELLVAQFLQENIYGIWNYNPSINLSLTEFTPYLLISFIIWAVVFVLSWLLYKNRKLETNGDVISFGFLKPIFMAAVSVFMGLLGYFYLFAILNTKSIFFLLPFGLLGIIISNMLIKKLLTFRGCIKPGVIYIIGVVLLYAIITFDLTGYERRIPDINDILSINIVSSSNDGRYGEENLAYWNNGEKYYYTDPMDPNELLFSDKTDIEKVINMHRALIKNKNDKSNVYNYIPIQYKLKNGNTLKRKYSINYLRDKDVLIPVYETKQMRLDKYHIFRDFEKTIIDVSVTDRRIMGENTTFKVYPGDDEKSKALLSSLEADILEAKYETLIRYNDTATKVRISYLRPAMTKDNKPYSVEIDNGSYSESITIAVPDSFIRTTELLKSYGLYDKIVKPEQIGHVAIHFQGEAKDTSPVITDEAQIKEIYDLCYNPTYTTQNDSTYPIALDFIAFEFYDKDKNPILHTNISYKDGHEMIKWPAVLIYEAEKWENNTTGLEKNKYASPAVQTVEIVD